MKKKIAIALISMTAAIHAGTYPVNYNYSVSNITGVGKTQTDAYLNAAMTASRQGLVIVGRDVTKVSPGVYTATIQVQKQFPLK